MNQNKNQGQQNQNQPDRTEQPQAPAREPGEKPRKDMPGQDQSGQKWSQRQQSAPPGDSEERGRGTQRERNASSEGDRGFDLDEQEDMSDRDSRQSER